MDQPLLAILLRDPDCRLCGGYDVIDVRRLTYTNIEEIKRLPLLCSVCYGPVTVRILDQKPTGERPCLLLHLGNDFGCMQEPRSSEWVTPLSDAPNTFSDISPSGRLEHDINEIEVYRYCERLTEIAPTRLFRTSSVSALVQCSQHHGASLSQRPFFLLGSSVTCWRDLIVDALPSEDSSSSEENDRKVFRGKLEGEHLAVEGNVLYFKERTGDKRNLECMIPYPSEGDRFKSILPKSFDHSSTEHDIYVLGSPRPVNPFKYSISLPSKRYVYISPRVITHRS